MHSSQNEGWAHSSYMRPSNWFLCHRAIKDKTNDKSLLAEASSVAGATRSYSPVVMEIKLNQFKVSQPGKKRTVSKVQNGHRWLELIYFVQIKIRNKNKDWLKRYVAEQCWEVDCGLRGMGGVTGSTNWQWCRVVNRAQSGCRDTHQRADTHTPLTILPFPEREVSTTGSRNTHYRARVCVMDNSPWSHASTTVDICQANADMNA